jgi:hypothetical protein
LDELDPFRGDNRCHILDPGWFKAQRRSYRFSLDSPGFGVSSTFYDLEFRQRGEGIHLSLIFMNIFDNLVNIVLTAEQE